MPAPALVLLRLLSDVEALNTACLGGPFSPAADELVLTVVTSWSSGLDPRPPMTPASDQGSHLVALSDNLYSRPTDIGGAHGSFLS